MKAIILSFIAPICEEILFRGFILSRFTYKFGIKKQLYSLPSASVFYI
ncbi:CPBP family intramembrane glutamic endopeptidase [Bacillus cytotoxicus]|nr:MULTISPECIES: CPBP family intramembrane glutamic endopeptidase [Bacillus cereus group]MDH2859775.1 CPBP family intramembrane metalloprotease [Bacillus cytotoxicus]MDH2872100.1 CPBP family intramembrane metalloprotease [Bacillus cytotoxicus]MDH2880750.1 CPBP family intramembrane metalloprotease [Bacillus cytotoxicus]MDH2886949.1 CPBP family intramembrane metalloprotease [Bacillus cytotoxicus]MDH2920934.1 CPBP family intramembrane metalloprotease [Bacillus cytotoxicus]